MCVRHVTWLGSNNGAVVPFASLRGRRAMPPTDLWGSPAFKPCASHVFNVNYLQTFRHVTQHEFKPWSATYFRPCCVDVVLLSLPMIFGIESDLLHIFLHPPSFLFINLRPGLRHGLFHNFFFLSYVWIWHESATWIVTWTATWSVTWVVPARAPPRS